MWGIARSDEYLRRHKKFEKKHPKELEAVLRNFHTVFETLQAGAKPAQVRYGFIHTEPRGVLAVDQGGGVGLRQTRLYFYPNTKTNRLHLITIGDKNTQKDDIEYCKRYAIKLEQEEREKEGQSK